MKEEKPRDFAWLPANYTSHDVTAIQAVAAGQANADQQKRALQWIMLMAAEINEISYRSDAHGGDRETAFAEGRRFVGLQVKKLAGMPPAMLAKLRKDEESNG